MPECAFPNCRIHAKTFYCIGHTRMMGKSKPPKENNPVKRVYKKAKKIKQDAAIVKKSRLAK